MTKKERRGWELVYRVKGLNGLLEVLMKEKDNIESNGTEEELDIFYDKMDKMLQELDIQKWESDVALNSFLLEQTNNKYNGKVNFEFTTWDEYIYTKKIK